MPCLAAEKRTGQPAIAALRSGIGINRRQVLGCRAALRLAPNDDHPLEIEVDGRDSGQRRLEEDRWSDPALKDKIA